MVIVMDMVRLEEEEEEEEEEVQARARGGPRRTASGGAWA